MLRKLRKSLSTITLKYYNILNLSCRLNSKNNAVKGNQVFGSQIYGEILHPESVKFHTNAKSLQGNNHITLMHMLN